MSRAIELLAPAKINLTLEVLGRRRDGYHEVATVMQTIDLHDTIRIKAADGISVEVTGEAAAGVPADPENNLAHRAAVRMAYWLKEDRGAKISIEKRIPAGMGLGGGSSDAAAVLRGLNGLWRLGRGPDSLARSGAELGSDVPFFVYCGSAFCRGRGERVDPLADCKPSPVTLFLPSQGMEGKTAKMYSEITPSDFTDGTTTRGVVDDIAMRGEVMAGSRNVFDRHADVFSEKVPVAMDACNRADFEVHLAGSGPAFFALRRLEELPARERALMDFLGIRVIERSFLGREACLRVQEV